MMDEDDVLAVLDRLSEQEVAVWVDGGWGIDALVGRQTRRHGDLDLVVAQGDCPVAEAALAGLGYAHDASARPGLPARIVLGDREGRRVDLHPVVFDARGEGWQPLGDGTWGGYPADGAAASSAGAGSVASPRSCSSDIIAAMRPTTATGTTSVCWPSTSTSAPGGRSARS